MKKLKYLPFLRFLVHWVLLLGGFYIITISIHLGVNSPSLLWKSLENDELRLVRIQYFESGFYYSSVFVAHTDNYGDHYLLSERSTVDAVSPDGAYIVFWEDGHLRIAHAATGEIITITLPTDLTSYRQYLAWSPDSRQIAFVNNYPRNGNCRRQTNGFEIIIASLDDHEAYRLGAIECGTLRSNVNSIAWSLDSQQLYLFFTYLETVAIPISQPMRFYTEDGVFTIPSSELLTINFLTDEEENNITYVENEHYQLQRERGLRISVFLSLHNYEQDRFIGGGAILFVILNTMWAYRRDKKYQQARQIKEKGKEIKLKTPD